MMNGLYIGLGIIGHIFGFLVFAFVVVAVIYLLVKSGNKHKNDAEINNTQIEAKAKEDEAMAILRQRYAKGEIGFEEYSKIKETL